MSQNPLWCFQVQYHCSYSLRSGEVGCLSSKKQRFRDSKMEVPRWLILSPEAVESLNGPSADRTQASIDILHIQEGVDFHRHQSQGASS